jgi:dTDP-4-amino-4,6-dideoxygalactose transaminase
VQHNQKKFKSVYHTFIIRVNYRDKLKKYLETKKIETKIHVKINSNKLKAAKVYGLDKIKLKNTDAFNKEILSLPISENLTRKEQDTIIRHIKIFYSKKIHKTI